MRRGMGLMAGMVAVCSLLALTPKPSQAAGVEKSLLGVRILQTYREVLKIYGAPTRVYRGNESVYVVESRNADGDLSGGIQALGDSATGGSGGAPSPGGGGGAGSARADDTGGGRTPGAKGGGAPSTPGGGSGGVGSGGDESNMTFGQSGGYIWAYFYPNTERLYLFKFNSQGRLLVAFERGKFGGGGTSRGIGLGSSLGSVYATYGWPDNVEEQGPGVVMNYSQKYHLMIAVLNGKVVGLAVSLFELPRLRMLAINEDGNGGGGSGGGGGAPKAGGGGGGPKAGPGNPGD